MIDPKALKYTDSHEWVHLDGDVATVGISKFAVDQLSDLILIDLPPIGKTLKSGQDFGAIESVKSVSDLYSPVAGEVIAVNPAVAADVQVLSQDPYEKGWLIKVKVADPEADLSSLMSHDSYEKKVADSDH
ncbi:MAG: glycine cleavage system protein [Planctomycetota bacterium]|nr:glycine cleavage system protein [Planctomycetota bacterium]